MVVVVVLMTLVLVTRRVEVRKRKMEMLMLPRECSNESFLSPAIVTPEFRPKSVRGRRKRASL